MGELSFLGYRCSICGKEFLPEKEIYTCPVDGGNLDVLIDTDHLASKGMDELIDPKFESIWRYLPLLPVANPGNEYTPIMAVGWTPMFKPKLLAEEIGVKDLWIKDESRNPTASFKDRASAILLARACEIDAEVIVTASTGNAGAALAGMAAAVGHQSVIFAPKNAPSAKISQLLIYGAGVILVDGNYDAAFDLSVQASQEFGWYCRNTGYNPFTAEGKKTAAFEIWETLLAEPFTDNEKGDKYESTKPLSIFVSVGDGNIISGIHKGFKDLQAMRLINETPRIFGVQSKNSAAIANAYKTGTEIIEPVVATTRADSISVDMPRDGLRALRAATQTGGAYITVSDESILKEIAALGKIGIFAEPAGSASLAGLRAAVEQGLIDFDDPVVVMNTGSGLKDVNAAMKVAGEPPIIEPTLDAVRKILC
jgi:threonine synthase